MHFAASRCTRSALSWPNLTLSASISPAMVARLRIAAAGVISSEPSSLGGEARIPQMDRVDGPEGRRNAGEAADSFFHPSRPPGSGYLVHRKSLISCLKSAHGAGKMPIHLGNPG